METVEDYRIKIIDVMCAAEDDMDRVRICQQFMTEYGSDLQEENKKLREALTEIRRYSSAALGASIVGTMLLKMCNDALSQPKEQTP